MEKYLGIIIPVAMSIGSALLTALFFTGKNLEKLKIYEEMQEQNTDKIKELSERVAKLEGVNDAR